jgi:hypothetical protein
LPGYAQGQCSLGTEDADTVQLSDKDEVITETFFPGIVVGYET